MSKLYERHGSAFSTHLPFFGDAVIISDPALAKELFRQPMGATEAAEPDLGLVLGSGSSFSLRGREHLRRRKLLMPQFAGERMRAYQGLIESVTLEETANWPEGTAFAVRETMMRITLNTILRGVFGAEGRELDSLRSLMPRMIALGLRLVMLPSLHRDFGPWSPWARWLKMRAELNELFAMLIERAQSDPHCERRTDVLSFLLRARYDDGSPMSHSDVGDELLALLVAGHETTATSLAWAIERLRRHPAILSRLQADLAAGDSALLQATVFEVLRSRPIIDAVARKVIAPSIQLGPWTIPQNHVVTVNIGLMHRNRDAFTAPERFDPDRFLESAPDMYKWVPFGGGVRRCPGASFANMEMMTVLRTVLSTFTLEPSESPGEARKARGVVFAPAKDGQAIVHRR